MHATPLPPEGAASPAPAAGPAPELTGRQLQVLQALLSGHTVASAARAFGVPERTLRHWGRQPTFRAFLQAGQQQLLQETCTLLSVAAAEAVRALVEVCQDPLATPAARVSAAGRILDLALRRLPAGLPDEEGLPAVPAALPSAVGLPVPGAPGLPGGPEPLTVPPAAPEPADDAGAEPGTLPDRQDPARSGNASFGEASREAAREAAVRAALGMEAPGPERDLPAGRPPLLAGHPFGPPPDLHRPLLREAAREPGLAGDPGDPDRRDLAAAARRPDAPPAAGEGSRGPRGGSSPGTAAAVALLTPPRSGPGRQNPARSGKNGRKR